MSVINDLLTSLNAIQGERPVILKKIDAILLHLRAREMEGQKRAHIVLCIGFSFFSGLVGEFLRFLGYPFTNTLKFIFCIVVGVVGLYLADNFLFVYLFAYVLSDIKHSMNLFRQFIFDAADLFLFGSVTKLFAKVVVDGRANACEMMLRDQSEWYLPTPIAPHFYASRHALHRTPDLATTEDKFLSLVTNQEEENTILTACSEYWDDFDLRKT